MGCCGRSGRLWPDRLHGGYSGGVSDALSAAVWTLWEQNYEWGRNHGSKPVVTATAAQSVCFIVALACGIEQGLALCWMEQCWYWPVARCTGISSQWDLRGSTGDS
jgi:hypothetical protein